MTHQEYAIQQDLKLIAHHESLELNKVNLIKSDWDRRNALVKHNQKFEVIKEALIGLNQLGLRPTYSLVRIIEEY